MSKKETPDLIRYINVPFSVREHARIEEHAKASERAKGQAVRLLALLALKKGVKP